MTVDTSLHGCPDASSGVEFIIALTTHKNGSWTRRNMHYVVVLQVQGFDLSVIHDPLADGEEIGHDALHRAAGKHGALHPYFAFDDTLLWIGA